MGGHEDLRIAVLIRNVEARRFSLFEEEVQRFSPVDFAWSFNSRNNLEGHDKVTGEHRFTWQPHGSQFTVIRDVPGSARKFSIKPDIPIMESAEVLAWANYQDDWIDIQE